MKTLTATLCLAAAIALPAVAQAREITLNTQMKSYSGNEAYLAIYVTDARGQYQSTLWVAGRKAKYYKHLRNWARGSGLDGTEFDGVTGASAGGGEMLTVKVELADALLDAGYQIRIDSSVEDKRDNRAEVIAPLTSAGAGKPTAGDGYVESFSYEL
jgi:hypothetical protein